MSTNESKQRVRVTKACDFCKRRKVRCSFQPGKICHNCEAYGEKCEFTPSTKKRGPQKGYADNLEQRIEQMEEVIKGAAEKKLQRIDFTPELSTIVQRKRPRRQKEQGATKLLSNLFEEFDVYDSIQWPAGISYDHVRYLGDLSSFQFFSKRLVDEHRWHGHTIKRFGEDVVLVADPQVASEGVPSSKIPEFEWPEDIHPRGESIHKYIYSVTGLDQYTALRLLKIYFLNIHPILPIINKTEFLKQYRDQIGTYPSGELLNAMFGAAARFVECERLDPERMKNIPDDAVWDVPVGWSDHFFDQAEFIISKWSTTPTLSKVQAIILILNHRGNRDSRSSACWQMGGFAIRLAHLLGLHRTCDDWEIPEAEKETRKRVWWALYITDRFQTALLGRPINIRDEDNNVSYPDARADREEVLDEFSVNLDKFPHNAIISRFPSLKTPSQDAKPAVYELFIQFIKLSEVLGRILIGLHSPSGKNFSVQHGSDGLISRLDHELTEWRFGFPTALRNAGLADFDEKSGHFAPTIASTLLFYFSTLILLHRPFIKKTVSKSSFTSRQICSSAATRGLRIASSMSVRDFLMCPYSFSLYPLMQCWLILMYNTKNPNPTISASAKSDLRKAIQLINRLKGMSSTATKLCNTVHKLSGCVQEGGDPLEEANVMRQDDLEEIEENLKSDVDGSKKKKHSSSPTAESITGSIMLQPPTNTNFVFQAPDDPLLLQNDSTQAEAFSLTQFGFDTNNDTSALDFMLYNMNTLPGVVTGLQQQQSYDMSLPLPDGNIQLNESNANNVFRNDPNNVFWNIPSSMDWDAWNTWAHTVDKNGWQPFD
ncbi:hypothetical protein K501DRAFT_324166 [Backusella circina FSU 941]|nr:hypothetical protein K501DRAFT_324166 [Backusella circina FSU 941]